MGRFGGKKGRRCFVPLNDEERKRVRQIPQLIVHLHDNVGLTFIEISDEIERRLALQEGREMRREWDDRPWKRDRCRPAYHREKAAQAAEARPRLPDNLEVENEDRPS